MKTVKGVMLFSTSDLDYGYFYYLLATRPKEANISHKKLPTWDEHVAYWRKISKIWRVGKILIDNYKRVGYVYITQKDEVGIHIDPKYWGRGIAKKVLGEITSACACNLYANIAPKNKRSIKLFQNAGFKLLRKEKTQNVYVRSI